MPLLPKQLGSYPELQPPSMTPSNVGFNERRRTKLMASFGSILIATLVNSARARSRALLPLQGINATAQHQQRTFFSISIGQWGILYTDRLLFAARSCFPLFQFCLCFSSLPSGHLELNHPHTSQGVFNVDVNEFTDFPHDAHSIIGLRS